MNLSDRLSYRFILLRRNWSYMKYWLCFVFNSPFVKPSDVCGAIFSTLENSGNPIKRPDAPLTATNILSLLYDTRKRSNAYLCLKVHVPESYHFKSPAFLFILLQSLALTYTSGVKSFDRFNSSIYWFKDKKIQSKEREREGDITLHR